MSLFTRAAGTAGRLLLLALVLLSCISAASARGILNDYGLPSLRSLTSYQAVRVGNKPVKLDPASGLLLPSGAWLFGVQAVYGDRPVPYLAPYTIHVEIPGKRKYALAMPEFKSDSWKLWREKCPSDTDIPVGLEPNAADRNGVFWFAILQPEALQSESSPGAAWGIWLSYPAAPPSGQPVNYEVKLAAADGTALATNIYLPFLETNPILPDPPYPVTLMRTPYAKDWIDPAYIAWTTRFNTVVVTQYFRGRPDLSGEWPASGGQPGLFSDHAGPEHSDAVDTVRWLAARHWCNGRILPTGPSGLGLWIYQAAPELGDQLAGIYPLVAAGDVGAWAAQENGCYKQANVETWLSSYKFPPEYLRKARERATDERYWDKLDFNAQAEKVNCPGLHETSWWDVSIEEGIKSWKAINTRGARRARGKQWLIVGPWPHDAPRTDICGELRFPTDDGAEASTAISANMVLDGILQSGKQALDEALNGKPAGQRGLGHDPSILPLRWDSLFWVAWILGRNPFYNSPDHNVLAYFVGEEGNSTEPNNTWFELLDWPPPYREKQLYLSPGPASLAGGVVSASLADSAPARAQQLGYGVDPLQPLATRGGPNIPLGELLNGPYDQRQVLDSAAGGSARLDGAQVQLWQTEPLARRQTIAGPLKLRLYLSTDSADTDLVVKLVDIYPEGFRLPAGWKSPGGADLGGRQLLVADTALRLSWWCKKQGLGKVQPGKVYAIDLNIGERAWVFEKGHRIGLHIQGSNAPRFAVNPGTGARFMDDGKGVVQRNTVWTGGEQASRLSLPLYEP
ncbi:CocE/NonD family hydrolase [bacterium]|nr:CocE/NonD family hydrolase [bacterium]